MFTKAEQAINMVKEAVVLSELKIKTGGKTAKDIDPIETMSGSVGSQLIFLVANEDEQYKVNVDWDARLWSWGHFMKQLLVLIGRPGVLDQLAKSERETASLRISKLYDFFTLIQDGYTKEWLQYVVLTDYPSEQTEKAINRVTEYYDFENRNESSIRSNHFESYEIERLKEMERVYPETHAFLNK